MTIKKTEQCWECSCIGDTKDFYTITKKNNKEYYCPKCIGSVKVEGQMSDTIIADESAIDVAYLLSMIEDLEQKVIRQDKVITSLVNAFQKKNTSSF